MTYILTIHCLIFFTHLISFSFCHEAPMKPYIILYSGNKENGTDGSNAVISVDECRNIPGKFAGNIIAINTRGLCARLHRGENCTGYSAEIEPRSPAHDDLETGWSLSKAHSVGPCRDPCDPEITGLEPDDDEPWLITLFQRPGHAGEGTSLTVRGCTPIPDFLVNTIRSVKTLGQCIQFYNNSRCTTEGQNADSIELRVGVPWDSDLHHWIFYRAESVSRCNYKCRSVDNSTIPAHNQLVFFSAPGFKGESVKQIATRCISLESVYFLSGDFVASIKIFKRSCVNLFRDFNCETDPVKLYRSVADVRRSYPNIYSVQLCKPRLGLPGHPGLGSGLIALIIVVPTTVILILAAFGASMWVKYRRVRKQVEMLTEKEIDEFRNGLRLTIRSENEYTVDILVENKPFNQALEVPASKIKFDSMVPLGQGEFGIVYKVAVEDDVTYYQSTSDKTSPVAMKTLKPNTSSAKYLRSLLKEVKLMSYVGHHPNIVKLVGCCTENLERGSILVLLEFCARGSMESFLRNNSQFFTPVPKIDYPVNPDDISSFFHTRQLVEWCVEIASAMEFLSEKKVIHGDLAARNVLLTQNLEAKVSDFGMSRQLYAYSEYVKTKSEPLPWRWMAIESLKGLNFSSKSDVWSYGVTCWEIFSMGERPYPASNWTQEFVRELETGVRPPKPNHAPEELYKMMSQCWTSNPSGRPDFSEILAALRIQLGNLGLTQRV